MAYIVLLVYFLVSSGFAVSVHYCMNKVDGISFGTSRTETCGKCGMHVEDAGGCCKDEVKVIKLQADQLVSQMVVPGFEFSPAIITNAPLVSEQGKFAQQISIPVAHGPPLPVKDIHILHCVFRC